MTGVRNAAIAKGSAPMGAFHPVFTVPAGYVLLAKSLYVLPDAQVAWDLIVQVAGGSPIGIINLVRHTGSTEAFTRWDGWIGMNPGDQLSVYVNHVNAWYWLSGALLPTSVPVPLE